MHYSQFVKGPNANDIIISAFPSRIHFINAWQTQDAVGKAASAAPSQR